MRGGANFTRRYNLTSPLLFTGVLVGCISCWIIGYIYSIGFPVYGEVNATPLWNTLCLILTNKTVAYLIGLTLTFGGAFLLHRANYALMLIREKTLLPFLLYSLFISTNPDFLPLKSTSLGVFCLILALYELFMSYHDDTQDKAFNAAFMIGVGSLLWIHILWFLPLFWYGMYKFRSFSLKSFMASILGALVVYWLVLGWCIWTKDFTPFSVPFSALIKIQPLALQDVTIVEWAGIVYVILLTILSAINIITHEYEDNVRTRQFLSFLTVFAFWAFVLYFLYGQATSEEFLEIACIPTSVLIAHFFTVVRNKTVFWLFHFTWIYCFSLLFIRIWNS